jgi:hypothetical protein
MGGTKYVVHNILFKFAMDTSHLFPDNHHAGFVIDKINDTHSDMNIF